MNRDRIKDEIKGWAGLVMPPLCMILALLIMWYFRIGG